MGEVEEQYTTALFNLAQYIAAGDKELADLQWQVARHPMDEIAFRKYWMRKTFLVERYMEVVYGRGGC